VHGDRLEFTENAVPETYYGHGYEGPEEE